MSNAPWWTFPRIDNFGQIDPQGNYWKPDSNIMTPYGYDVASLGSGTVTDVTRTSWGQSVVTIKLDTPVNNLATHTFYEHMHDAVVSVGQHISTGTLIGHANYQGEGANLGFGLYSGDSYGSGSAWSVLQADLAPGGAGLLNPVTILNNARNGNITLANTTSSSDPTSSILSGLGLPTSGDVQLFIQKMGLIFVGGLLLLIGVLIVFLSGQKAAV